MAKSRPLLFSPPEHRALNLRAKRKEPRQRWTPALPQCSRSRSASKRDFVTSINMMLHWFSWPRCHLSCFSAVFAKRILFFALRGSMDAQKRSYALPTWMSRADQRHRKFGFSAVPSLVSTHCTILRAGVPDAILDRKIVHALPLHKLNLLPTGLTNETRIDRTPA